MHAQTAVERHALVCRTWGGRKNPPTRENPRQVGGEPPACPGHCHMGKQVSSPLESLVGFSVTAAKCVLPDTVASLADGKTKPLEVK